jgi:hypothetical protein
MSARVVAAFALRCVATAGMFAGVVISAPGMALIYGCTELEKTAHAMRYRVGRRRS